MTTITYNASKLTTLHLTSLKSWLVATAFIAGNIILPQLVHFIPQGGLIFLPIYFFTLVGAYLYGWQVGLLTAIVSPLINSALFGMPATAMLPIIMMKGSLLAAFAAFAAKRLNRATILSLTAVVISSQALGCIAESLMAQDLMVGISDFRIGFPGLMLQIFGGWYVINKLA